MTSEPQLFYIEAFIDSDNLQRSFLICASDEDEALGKLREDYGEVFYRNADLTIFLGNWEQLKEKLDEGKIVEVF